MNTPSRLTRDLSVFDRLRIFWAATRYDMWLDLKSVPRRQRRELRAELRSNLAAAASDVGLPAALERVGSIRALATEAVRDGELRSRWLAGAAAAATTLAVGLVSFMLLTLYYAEGVLDSGATQVVGSSLFPFFGSNVNVDPSAGGLAASIQPGPMPFVVAALAWLAVAKPWRTITDRHRVGSPAT